MHNILIQFLSFRGIYICLKKKGKPTLKKKIVFLFRFLRATNRRDKIYASIRIASPRPTIVRNDNVSQINFPAIIPRSAGIGDLTRFNRASIPSLPPNCRLLSSLHPRETKSRCRVSSVLSILEYRRKWKKIWKIGKMKDVEKLLRNFSYGEDIYI